MSKVVQRRTGLERHLLVHLKCEGEVPNKQLEIVSEKYVQNVKNEEQLTNTIDEHPTHTSNDQQLTHLSIDSKPTLTSDDDQLALIIKDEKVIPTPNDEQETHFLYR